MDLKRYRFAADYSSGRGVWTVGQEIDVTPDEADWFNRDVPGCLVLVDVEAEHAAEVAAAAEKLAAKEKKAEERAEDKPPADRQVKAPESKRGA